MSTKSTPRDVFANLLSIIVLTISVVAFVNVVFQMINIGFPDSLDSYVMGYQAGLRSGIAALLVAWPFYLIVERMIRKDFAEKPEKRQIRIRRWLLHLALFVAAIVIMVDLITLINVFLSGEITIRFILKVIAVLVVALCVFWFYRTELSEEGWGTKPVPRMMAIATSVVGLAAIIGGIFLAGSPAAQRNQRLDEQRVYALQSIQWQVDAYYQQHGELPVSLDLLSDPLSGFVVPFDPETNEMFGYRVVSENTFELCATFAAESDESIVSPKAVPTRSSDIVHWNHGVGETCFERTVERSETK